MAYFSEGCHSRRCDWEKCCRHAACVPAQRDVPLHKSNERCHAHCLDCVTLVIQQRTWLVEETEEVANVPHLDVVHAHADLEHVVVDRVVLLRLVLRRRRRRLQSTHTHEAITWSSDETGEERIKVRKAETRWRVVWSELNTLWMPC